jgi:hypothetical protein
MDVPTLYVRAVELVLRNGRTDGCTCFVRFTALPSALKVEGARRPCVATGCSGRSVVHWNDDILLCEGFFGRGAPLLTPDRHLTPETQQVEVKVVMNDAEKGEVVLGQHVVELKTLTDHVASELWLTLIAPLAASRSAAALSPVKSPRLKAEQSGALGATQRESDLHLLLYAARTSDKSAVEAKLQGREYATVLAQLAQEPPNLALELCALTPQALGDKMAAAVVTLLHRSKKVLPFIRAIVEQEVSTTTSSSVLFRSNSMAIRMLSAYGRIVGGPYLQQVLGDLVKQVCRDDVSYEPDPQIMGPEVAAANGEYIAKLSARFLARILESSDVVPAPFRIVCSDLRTIVGAKFADFWPRAVGGFFFLRFLCPVIASPTTAGLVDVVPSKNARRTLILVTKVLQNVANQTAFNEAWMSKAEECVKEHVPLVEKFLGGISVVDDRAAALWASEGEEKTSPDAASVFKAIGELKEICVGSFQVGSPLFMECLKQTSRSAKPYAHTGAEDVLKSVGGLSLETEGPTPFWDDTKNLVLNYVTCLKMLPLDTEQTAYELAHGATQVLKTELEKEAEKGPFEEGVFIDWAAVRLLPAFATFERNLSDLHHVRPDSIPVEARGPFWINVYNAVNFHLHVITDGKPSKGQGEWYYAVAGHLFTCDEIGYGILRGNTVRGRGARKNLFFKADDPRRNFVLTLDNKVNFCLATFGWDSPVLRPYDRDVNGLRKAAAVYCEKFIQNDIVKTEVVIPKLLDENKADWTEEDVLQRVLQLVQFVTSRKLDILQTLTNPKVCITVSKAKGPAHPIYWLGQMRTDAKDLLQKKEAAAAAASTAAKLSPPSSVSVKRLTLNRDDLASLSSVITQAANSSPRDPQAPVSPAPSSPISIGNPGWQRASRAPPNALSSSEVKVTKLGANSSPKASGTAPLGGSAGSAPALRVEPRLRPESAVESLDLKARRSPRSPRVGLRGVFLDKEAGLAAVQRSSGFQDDDRVSSPRSESAAGGGVTAAGLAATVASTESPGNRASLTSSTPLIPGLDPLSTSGSSLPSIPPKPLSPPASPPRSPRNKRPAPPIPGTAAATPSSPLPPRTSPSPSVPESPRVQSPSEVVSRAQSMANLIRSHLDNVLVDSAGLLEFDVAIKTGKVLMQLRKSVMAFLGWSEMPTSVVQQVPQIVLSKLQERFLPESKHAMFVKLVQAFHSAVQDVHVVLDEMLFIAPTGQDEITKWKAREAELVAVFKEADKLLSDHRDVLTVSLRKEDEYVEVMELSDVLKPELKSIAALLARFAEELEKGTPENLPQLCRVLARSKSVLETGEENGSTIEEETVANAKAMVAVLTSKFASVSEAVKSVTTTTKGLLLLTSRARQVNVILSSLQ